MFSNYSKYFLSRLLFTMLPQKIQVSEPCSYYTIKFSKYKINLIYLRLVCSHILNTENKINKYLSTYSSIVIAFWILNKFYKMCIWLGYNNTRVCVYVCICVCICVCVCVCVCVCLCVFNDSYILFAETFMYEGICSYLFIHL